MEFVVCIKSRFYIETLCIDLILKLPDLKQRYNKPKPYTMHPKILICQSNECFKVQKVLNLVSRRLFSSTNKQVPHKGKQWMLVTASRSFSKEGPESFGSTFKGGQKVMAIRRYIEIFSKLRPPIWIYCSGKVH